ncbi:hypothetical protein OH492_27215 [Vibrio chagasii]|nr:hypothetical protein [Vibrio chagasii]
MFITFGSVMKMHQVREQSSTACYQIPVIRDVSPRSLNTGEIDIIATDHAPHTWEEKQVPRP